jgi:uncharacterized sulfatase
MPDTSKMNVLFIDIEDCNASVFGCYGHPICKTPNVDRLAATGVRFDRAYCQYPCCNPSRSSFLTGLRPPSSRVLANPHNSRKYLPPGTLSLPQLIKQKDFYAANISKLFHYSGRWNEEDMRVFDRIEMSPRPKGWTGPDPIISFPPVPKSLRSEKMPKPRTKEWGTWYRKHSDRYGDSGRSDLQEHDGQIARTAVALLEEFTRTKKRFFLSMGSSRPHTPLICPKKYVGMYDPSKIPLPPAPREKDRGIPGAALRLGHTPDVFIGRKATPQQAREAVAAYYACVSFVDAGIGMVLDALEELGLADNTIVIFFADHGFHLGDHGLWSKYTLFEQSTRVPLIVRVPGAPGNGKVCHGMVELVDLVQTIGELVDLSLPDNLEGTSLVPLLVNPSRPWKKGAFTYYGNKGQHLSVSTRRYRYTEWKIKDKVVAELYDLKTDPFETVNLADDETHAARRKELSGLLHAGWKAALPPK